MQIEEHDIVRDTRTGLQWVVLKIEGDRYSVVRRGELGKVYGLLLGAEIEVSR